MKQKIFSFSTMLVICMSILAVPVAPDNFIEEILPDGTVLRLKVCGDEYCNWTESLDGYMVIKTSTGDYKYAIAEKNKLVVSDIRIGDPSHVNLINKAEIRDILSANRNIAIQKKDSISKLNSEIYGETNRTQTTSNFSFAKGNQKVLCILIQFPDRTFNIPTSEYEDLWNSASYTSNGNHGSVNQFYRENSCNQLNVTATVVGPYTASHNWSYYQTGLTNGLPRNFDRSNELIREAMSAARADVRFSDFDQNNNLAVDVVHVIFAGLGMENDAINGAVWSHQGRISPAVMQAGIRANDYFCTPEYYNSETLYPTIGTICHEYGHFIGAPDYYDVANKIFPGTGEWDVMCNSHANNGKCPPHHNPYTKCYIYEWCTPSIITSATQNYAIAPSHLSNNFYRINTTTNGEFFLLENKAKMAFNSYVPTSGGNLLIYHIHQDITNHISNNSVNTGSPQYCYIVSSNATTNPTASPQSYCRNYSIASYPGTDNGIDSANIFFTAHSTPSAISWNGTPTGVDLCFIRKSGNNINFSVNPVITGPSVISDQETFTLPTIPYPARVKWTYTTANISPRVMGLPPISFVNGTTSQSATIKRNYALMREVDPINPIDPGFGLMGTLGETGQIYYTGTVYLTATITCGGQSYSITKTIQLANSSAASTQQAIAETDGAMNIVDQKDSKSYTLKIINTLGARNLNVSLLEDGDTEEFQYQGTYTLELWNLTTQERIRHLQVTSSPTTINTGKLPEGYYQLIAYINGKIVSSQRLFIR